MSAPFKDATNDAVQFLTKHGDLTRAAAYDAIRLLTGNGFVVTQTDMLPSATDLSQAAVAAALEAAAAICADHMAVALQDEKDPEALKGYARGMYFAARQQGIEIRALITQPQHDALAAHVAADAANARADAAEAQISGARDAIAYVLDGYGLNGPDFNRQPEDDPDDWIVLHLRAAILALRDKTACVTQTAETAPQPGLCDTSEPQPAPAVTVRLETLRPIWKAHGGEWHGPKVERWSIPEDQMVTFFHAALAAIKEPKT